PQFAMKGGIGACAYRQGDLMVGAIVACNAMGDVLEKGRIIAGSRNDEDTGFADSEEWLIANGRRQKDIFSGKFVGENTVIGCVITNAALNKAQASSWRPWPRMALPVQSVPPMPPLMGMPSLPCAGELSRPIPMPWAAWRPGLWKKPLFVL
ncbi:MAG: P1 family peptidase, partial [Ruminiclostridium sp.]|nr:P1 family peptidase [Ruminiclostridium sp.]